MSESSIYVRFPKEADAAALADLNQRNRTFFGEFSPMPPIEYDTVEEQLSIIIKARQDREADRKYSFVICRREDDAIVGTVDLSFVARGAQQQCMIGFGIDQAYNGKGYMTEAIQQVVSYAFETLHFHGIIGEASPRNHGSIRVMEKAGFHREGISRSNLKVHEKWEDHQVLAIINPAN